MSFSGPHLSLNTALTSNRRVLVVGLHPDDLPQWPGQTLSATLCFLPFSRLRLTLAGAASIDCVVSPLVAPRFDALEVAAELSLAGFCGSLVLIMPRVPRPEIIYRELMQICPGLSVEMVAKAPH